MKRTRRTVEHPPCSKGRKQFLHNARGGEFRLYALQCVPFDLFDPELPSVLERVVCQYSTEYPPLLPKSTSSEENMTVVFATWHPPLDHCQQGASQRSPRPCRHRKGVPTTCESVSLSSRGRSDLAYVFHAPDISITTSRLPVTVASVRYCLSGTSKILHPKKPATRAPTVPPYL